MAINRSVGRSAVSVAEAHLARVAADGSSRHPHLECPARRLRPAFRPRPRRRGASAVQPSRPPSGPDRARARSMPPTPLPATGSPEPPKHSSASGFILVRLTSAVGPMPSTPGAAETEAACLRSAMRWKFSRRRSAAAARLAPPPRWSATGGRSAACSTAPRRGPASIRPAPVASRRSLARRGDQCLLGHAGERARARLRRRAIAAPAPRPVRPARSPRRSARRLLKEKGPCEAGAPPSSAHVTRSPRRDGDQSSR